MRTLLALSALALASLASACANSVDTADADSFGAAVSQMHRAQTDGDDATSREQPADSGATAARAQTRYRTGETAPLASSGTSANAPR